MIRFLCVISLILLSTPAFAQRAIVGGLVRATYGVNQISYGQTNLLDMGVSKNKTYVEIALSTPLTYFTAVTYYGMPRVINNGSSSILGEVEIGNTTFGEKDKVGVINTEITTGYNAIQLELPYLAQHTRPLVRVESIDTAIKVSGGTDKKYNELDKSYRTIDLGLGIASHYDGGTYVFAGNALYLFNRGLDFDVSGHWLLGDLSGTLGLGYRYKAIRVSDLNVSFSGLYIEATYWF
jgi:hypothetical protein